MNRYLIGRAMVGALSASACLAFAQAPATAPASSAREDVPAVVVTGSPLGSGLFELAQPADVLAGRRLWHQRRSSLGETLDGMPGVSASYFGPVASRPVIRGLDGDRIRLLQNGVGTGDVSSLSFDHAVPYDPLVAERIEVVRGPAAVLYGGNAVGGVVNVIDGRIPERPVTGFSGRIEPRLGGADDERSLGAVLEAGNGTLAVHADVFGRKSGDTRIPGFTRSARQRATDGAAVAQPQGRIPNTSAKSEGGSLGASLHWGSGHVGLAYQSVANVYGSPAETAVRIDLESERWDLAGEARDLGPVITAAKFKLGRTNYEHREIESGAINTRFLNKGEEARLELSHGRLGPLTGAFGFQATGAGFSAIGAEAFVPATDTDAKGVFLYEEWALGAWKLSLGARADRTRVASQGGGAVDVSTGAARFGAATAREFRTGSQAFGAVWKATPALALVANVSSTERAPTYYELFANGRHVATGAYEVGTATLDTERARALDAAVRWSSGPHGASLGVFRQRFRNYVGLFATGTQRGADGERDPVDADGDGRADGSGSAISAESRFRAVPALFRGVEASARLRAFDRIGLLDFELKADRVRATDRSTGRELPRIAPARLTLAADYTFERLHARTELVRASAQNRVAAGELPTSGYTLVNATLAWRFRLDSAALEAFVRANNLLDREARSHASFLKDRAPLPGRGVLVGLRGSF